MKIAKQMRKESLKDIVGLKYVRDENGTLKLKGEKVMESWRSNFSLLNKTNEIEMRIAHLGVQRNWRWKGECQPVGQRRPGVT